MIMIHSTIIFMSFPNISQQFQTHPGKPHAHHLRPVNDGTILPRQGIRLW